MARCAITGVQLELHCAYILDLRAAIRVAKNLRSRLQAVDKLIDQFGSIPRTFHPNRAYCELVKRRRLLCKAVANAINADYPEEPLFMPWGVWKESQYKALQEWQRAAIDYKRLKSMSITEDAE